MIFKKKFKMICKKCNTIFPFKKEDKTFRIKHKKGIWYHYLKCPICGYENVTDFVKFKPMKKHVDYIINNKGLIHLQEDEEN